MNEWEEIKNRIEQEKLMAREEWIKGREEARKLMGKLPRRAITADELKKLVRLRRVSMQSSGQDHLFMRQFRDADETTQLRERQGWYIDVLWYKYRRQLGHQDPRPNGYGYERK